MFLSDFALSTLLDGQWHVVRKGKTHGHLWRHGEDGYDSYSLVTDGEYGLWELRECVLCDEKHIRERPS